jgi:hypothetical protein
VQTSGCLNCHSLALENQFAARSLDELPAERWSHGCLSETENRAPYFGFSATERAAWLAFANSDRQSIRRHVPADFAERASRNLNCRECHGKFDGFPLFEGLGGKLKPEWSARFLAGAISDKPRPWLEARMPAFAKWAEPLAKGLAMSHGFAPRTPVEAPPDAALAAIGQKLVSAEGGFSCVSCHDVGKVKATQVFEGPGINLAFSFDRLLQPYYFRWLRNPQAIDPATKMPAYFIDGTSPLTEVLEGSPEKQIDAMWQYIRLGPNMPPPPGTQPSE